MKLRLLLSIVALAAFAGCSTVGQRETDVSRNLRASGLVPAERLIAQAGKGILDKDQFVVCNLRAADLAREAGANPRAERILRAATAAVSEWVVANQPLAKTTYSFGGFTYDLKVEPPGKRGVWNAAGFKSVGDAAKVPRKLLRNWHERPGVGAPLTAQWNSPADERLKQFTPDRGYITPVTAVITFQKARGAVRTATLSFLDPAVIKKVKIDGEERELAADFTAPIMERIRGIREFLIALEGTVHPGVRGAYLYMMEPYDPKRIPVIFVHGLLSHPRMWRDVINDLRADPELCGRFQFWTFFYPTGWPISYSAMRLREELTALEQVIGPQRNMVFVGHSMGGLLARMQVIDPGTRFLDTMLSPSDRAKVLRLPSDNLIRRLAIFKPDPGISRVVFISTPHRGSRMADMSVTRWFSGLVRLPGTLIASIGDVGIDFAKTLTGNPRELSSLRRLSPSNPMFKALDTVPIPVPHHSIMGDRGRGDTPNSSDGVVAYWSSHLETAESEVIVPDDHGAFDDPAAIAELKRILKLQMQSTR